jgi:uncharacterized protein with FMN-binding domain
MEKLMKVYTKLAARVLAVILLITEMCLLGGCSAMSKMEATKSLTITTPNYSHLADGTYRGAYNGGLVVAELAVTIDDGRIESVDLVKHDHGRGGDAEKIVENIVAAQSLEVDVIAGATVSSKAILKAAENALRRGN